MKENFLTHLPEKLSYLLEQINQNSHGIIFLVDEGGRLIGSLSDGDIRRGILRGENLDVVISSESTLFNHSPQVLPFDCSPMQVWQLLNKGLRAVPLLDKDGVVIDVATREKIHRIPISEPVIGSQEFFNVNECLKSGWISSQGSYITQFEDNFSSFLGGGYSVAVSNGTVALQLALKALKIGPGDEVLVPDLTFAASINAVIHSGAIPKIVDIDPVTWGMSVNTISDAIGPATKAIMPVHIYGQPVEVDSLYQFAREKNLLIIEDCAESLGATYKNNLVGLQGDCSCFSFFANKVITTGEGGMACFRDEAVANYARSLRDHGMKKTRKYWHEVVGYNFRMTNIQAAIGVAQLGRISELRSARERIFSLYDDAFIGEKSIIRPLRNNWSTNSYWLYTLRILGASKDDRDLVIQEMANCGVDVRPGFYPLHQMPPYIDYAMEKYNVSNEISSTLISLPTSSTLDQLEIEFIAQQLLKALKKYGLSNFV